MMVEVPQEMADAILKEAIVWHYNAIASDFDTLKHPEDIEINQQTMDAFVFIYNYFTGETLCPRSE